jgi:hypothetical protein
MILILILVMVVMMMMIGYDKCNYIIVDNNKRYMMNYQND